MRILRNSVLVACPRATRGEATEVHGLGFLNDWQGFKLLGNLKSAPRERWGERPGELLVVGEREGEAVWVCRNCRERMQFPVILTGKTRVR